jgi:diadenosine tetraphosphate (Ap4A) HIT family hydrolase
MFILDKKLQQDSFFIGDLELCKVLLMNDANYPWLILVPRQNNLKDIIDLSFDDQIILLKEINFVAEILKKEFECDKLNIANLGNVVSQLHIHVIARKKNDITFPKPVWGNASAVEYCGNNLTKTLEKIQKYFNNVDRKSA